MGKPFTPEIVWKRPEDLTPYANNSKLHSNEQIDKIAGLIAAFGFDQPIVVDAQGVILKGHGRREAALRLALPLVPVIVNTLDEYKAIASRIADNKVAEAPWDPEKLRFDIGTLQRQEFKLDLTGFDPSAIENLLKPMGSTVEFGESRHKSMEESLDGYEHSDIRQMILAMDTETFEKMMQTFMRLQEEFGVQTNLEVVQELIARHDPNSTSH